MDHSHHQPQETTWKNYLPLMVVATFILGGTAILSTIVPNADWMRKIMFFEGLMLSFFALFKLLDVKGFQEGYSTYDLITKQIPAWGYIYPFVELGLGVLLLLGFWTLPVSIIVALLSVVGLVSVSIELKKKRKFQCACLGTALNVPLTKVTRVENGIMLVLAIVMATNLLNAHGAGSMNMNDTTHNGHSVTIKNDREFLEHMVPHHQDAIDASRVVANRTGSAEVKQLTESIIAAQDKEISDMKAWYKSWYGVEFPATTSYKAMMSDYQNVSQESMDDKYLSEMIVHHQLAIDTARVIRDKAEHAEVKSLAQNIIDSQQTEIDKMKEMRK
jgi:uncharacterized protein (DUF305 family)